MYQRTVLFIIVVCSLCSSADYISPEIKKMYHEISAGRGLYTDFNKITNLNSSTFKNTVFNNTKNNAWIIEFYNSWCGHCHRFAPLWKQFAADIYDWRDVISVGAVDCSVKINTPLCRDYDVMYYPMLKYFPPLPANDFIGMAVSTNSGQQLLNEVLKILRDDSKEGIINQRSLIPISGKNINSLWDGISGEVLFIVLIIQKNDMYLGDSLALDLLKIKKLKVFISFENNKELTEDSTSTYPALYIADKNNVEKINIDTNIEREEVYDKVRLYLNKKGLAIPKLKIEKIPTISTVDISEIVAIMELEEQIKKKLNRNAMFDVVFQVDLENALKHSLTVEIPGHKDITGDAMIALKKYIQILVDFFPIVQKGKEYLKSIMREISNKTEISGSSFGEIEVKTDSLYSPYLSPNSSWLGCRGSEPKFRGYPCGIWMMFHTLTIQADFSKSIDTKQVLRAMVGYIKHFFGCTDCSDHFLQMAETLEGNVTTNEDSVLWLWNAHNSANKRLKLDTTEDPKHPKVIFPPPSICPSCYLQNGSWNESAVLVFLKSMYNNISYFLVEDVLPPTSETFASKSLKHENIIEEASFNYSQSEAKALNFNFNVFDVSICVLLYAFSMVIILFICLKFLYKRTSRKKTCIYDIFQKV